MSKRDWWLIGGLTLAAALGRFINLRYPQVIIFDETYFANFAHDYLTNTKFFDAEPPLGKFLIAGGEWLFGYNSFGWRVAPALFGTAVIPLLYLFVKRLFGSTLMAAIAASLALLDGLLLVESRTAVLDGFVVFFNLLTYTLFLYSLQAGSRRRSLLWLAGTGVAFGLALSLKWITLAFLGPAILLLIILKLADQGRVLTRLRNRLFRVRNGLTLLAAVGAKRPNLHHPLTYLWFLGVIPLAIYLTLFQLHVPYDSTGGNLWEIHKQIYNYHHTLQATHPYGSVWYSWPFLTRPVAYYFDASGGQWAGIVALGNPVIWWSGLLALFYLVWRFVKTRNILLFFVLLAFVAHFAPWSLISRVLFLYHYLGALPFVMVALAYALSDRWYGVAPRLSQSRQPTSAPEGALGVFAWGLLIATGAVLGGLLGRSLLGQASVVVGFGVGGIAMGGLLVWLMQTRLGKLTSGQKQVLAFLGIVALVFIYFLPVWTGIGLDTADYNRRMWIRSWV